MDMESIYVSAVVTVVVVSVYLISTLQLCNISLWPILETHGPATGSNGARQPSVGEDIGPLAVLLDSKHCTKMFQIVFCLL